MRKHKTKRLVIILASLLYTALALAQNKSISGKVVDVKNGEELIGVTVSITRNGNTSGTITDLDGAFQLQCTVGEVLKFSFIGYQEKLITIGNENLIHVRLSPSTENLDELVVIGYGTQKKESVVGAIASVGRKDIVDVPASNLTQALAGRLSGVQVVQTSGEVGRDEADIYIRGAATPNNSSPVIVIDGVMRESFAHIDPNEIQSINILKDASATAVYGIKGANGVIIVTTRRGRVSKPKVSASFETGIAQPTRIQQPLDAYPTAMMQNMRDVTADKVAPTYSREDLMLYRTGASPYTHPDYSWTDVILKDHSNTVKGNVNVSGGTETVKYFISGAFYTQNSAYNYDPYTKFSRYNFRSNFDIKVTEDFNISLNVGSRVENRKYPATVWNNSWSIYHGAFATSGRDFPYLNMDGSLGGIASRKNNIIGNIKDSGEYGNVKSVLEMGLILDYNLDAITKGLSVKGQVAFDDNSTNETRYTQDYSVYEYSVTEDSYTQHRFGTPLAYSWGNIYNKRKLYGELSLVYNRTFKKHSVHAMVLANRDLYRVSATNASNVEMPYASQGLVSRATYNFNSRYFVEGSLTYNGSENFPAESRYGLFPSASLGWMISNERFIKESNISSFLNTFKIRTSYGLVGNDKLEVNGTPVRFMYLPKYVNDGGAYFGTGNNWHSGIQKPTIENTNVQWEIGRKFNIGIETNFLDGLIGLNIDYFNEYRNNILTDQSSIIPYYVGAEFEAANIGIVTNQGVEVELKHGKSFSNDVSYFINGNFSYAHNEIIQTNDAALTLDYQKKAGFPIGSMPGYEVIGIFEDYDDIENSPAQIAPLGGINGNNYLYPGDIKYKDVNGDGVINQDDQKRIEYPSIPEIGYGVNLGVNYKGFGLTALIQGAARASFPKNWEIMNPLNNSENALEHHWDYWTPLTSGESEYKSRLYNKEYYNNAGRNSYSIGSGNYVRLKNVQFSYTFPNTLSSKIKMSNIKVFVTGQNLYILSSEDYLDPDNRDYRGGVMPPLRNFNCGINVKF